MAKNLKTVYQIEATGSGQLKGAFDQVNETLTKSAKQAKETSISFSGLGGGLATIALKFNAVTGAASTAIAGIKKLADVIHEGAKLADASKNFEKTGLSLERLAKASSNTQTNAEIERAITKTKEIAAANGLAGKAYEDLMYSALQLADAYDQQIEPVIKTVLKATSGATNALKEQFGIVVDVDKSMKDYAESLGVAVDTLTAEEKQTARNIAVQNALNEAAVNFPSKDTVTWLDRITTALDNALDSSKKFLAEWIFGKELPAGVSQIAHEAETLEENYLKALEDLENQAKITASNLGVSYSEALEITKKNNTRLYNNLLEAQKEFNNAALRAQEEADFKAFEEAEKAAKNREIEERNHARSQLELDQQWQEKRLESLKSANQKRIEEIYAQWEKEAQAAIDGNFDITEINKYYQGILDTEKEKQDKERRDKDKARFDAAKKELEAQQNYLNAVLFRISESQWNAQQHTETEREERAHQRRVEDAERQIKNKKLLQATLEALEREHLENMTKARQNDEKRVKEEFEALARTIEGTLEKSATPQTTEEGRAKEAIEKQRKQFDDFLSEIRKAKEENEKYIKEGNEQAIAQAELLNARELELIERRKQAEIDAQAAIYAARERDFQNTKRQTAQKMRDQITLNETQKEGIDGIIKGSEELEKTLQQFGSGAGIIQTASMIASGIKAGCDAIDYAAESTAAFATGNIVAGVGLAAASAAKFASAAQYAKGLADLGAQGFTIPSQKNTTPSANTGNLSGSQVLTGQKGEEKQEISVNLTFKGEQANIGRMLINEMNKEVYVKGGARLNPRVVR